MFVHTAEGCKLKYVFFRDGVSATDLEMLCIPSVQTVLIQKNNNNGVIFLFHLTRAPA